MKDLKKKNKKGIIKRAELLSPFFIFY